MEIVAGILAAALVLLAAFLGLAIRRRPWKTEPSDDMLRTQFQALSQEALSKASEQFLTLAEQRFTRQTEAGASVLDTKNNSSTSSW